MYFLILLKLFTMKRIFLLLFAVGIMNGSSYGQNHQISPGFGVLTTNSFLDILSNVGKNTVEGVLDGSKLKNKRYVGDFRISYAYDISNSFSMGMTLSYLKASGDYYKSGEFVGDQRIRSEEHTSELQSRPHLVCRLLLEKKKKNK